MMKLSAVFIVGYLWSWFAHGKLLSRLRTTIRFMKDSGYTFKRAWNLAGRVI
jgi:hypothetical protein